jgi:hypothetical protein
MRLYAWQKRAARLVAPHCVCRFCIYSVHLDEQNRHDLSNHDSHEPGVNGNHDPLAIDHYNVKVITGRWRESLFARA